MNYLAHALLSPPDTRVFLGNFCGDFVKGSQNPGLEERVWQGVKLHRAIDSTTDTHPLVRKGRNLFSRKRRRYAGIILDIAFDFFLSRHWDQFGNIPRPDFIQQCYFKLNNNTSILPIGFHSIRDHIIHNDWLKNYHSLKGIAQTLDNLSHRFTRRTGRANEIFGSVEEIIKHRENLEALFLEFFPEIMELTSLWSQAILIREDTSV